MGDLVERLVDAVGRENVRTGTEVHDDYTHDEALTATPVVPLAVVTPGSTRPGGRRPAGGRRDGDAGHGPGQRDRSLGRLGAPGRRDRGLVRKDERDPGDRHREPRGRGPAGRDPGGAGPGHGRARSRLPGLPGREQRLVGRQRGHQRRRDAGHQIRGDPSSGPGPRSRPGHRRGDPDGWEVREGLDRLRPDPAHRRLGRDARSGHRSDREALSPGRPGGHGPRPFRHARPGGRGRAPDRGQWGGPAHPRVHRHAHHGGHHGQRRSRPRDPRKR